MKNIENMKNEALYELSINTEDIETLIEIFNEIQDRIYIEIANGNLAKLYNMREKDGTLFDDDFFDSEEIAKKFDWDEENECRACKKENSEILKLLDANEKKSYIEYIKECICAKYDELKDYE